MGNTASSSASVLAAFTDDELIAAAVQPLTHDLGDDVLPRICPGCLELAYGMTRAVTGDQIRANSRELFQACMRVLTRRRSEDETGALRRQLQKTMRDCPKKLDHPFAYRIQQGAKRPSDPTHALVDTLYSIVNLGLASGSHAPVSVHENPKRAPGHKKNLWPTNTADLLPFEANECAEAHVLWCCTQTSPEPFAFLRYAIVAYRPTLVPYIIRPPLKEQLLWTLACMLYADFSSAIPKWPGSIPRVGSTSPQDAFWSRDAEAKVLSAQLAVSVFFAISHGLEGSLGDLYSFVAGYEEALLPAVTASLPRLDDGDPNKVYLARLAQELARDIGVSHSALGPDVARLTEHLRHSAPLSMLEEIVHRRFMSRDCYGPSCGRSVHESTTGKPFQRCGRCRFVQYCSKECQVKDWKEAKVPHKDLCPLLQKLVKVGRGCSHEEFEAEFKKSGLDLIEDCVPIFTWGALRGDLQHASFSVEVGPA